jgi:PAS domain S-box-containing protein
VIGVALIVVPIVLLVIGQTSDRQLQRVATEIDPVTIRLARVHVDIVKLIDEAMRSSLADTPDMNAYDRASTRYTASRALLSSAARGTPYEQEVASVFLHTDEAAEIAHSGLESAVSGNQDAARQHLVGRGARAMEDVSASVAELQDRLDADGDRLRDFNRRLSTFELILGAGGSLLGAVTVLSLLVVELARRRLQFERERASSRFAGMVEATGFGVVELDRDREVEYANPAAAEMLGYDPGTLLGIHISQFLGSIDASAGAAQAGEAASLPASLLRNEAFFGEVVLARRDGSPVVFEVSSAPLMDRTPEGYLAPYGTVLVFQDMTERLEREREQAEFLALASHELRTPLTSLLGFSRRLRRAVERGRLKVDSDTREEIETLNQEAERMRDTIALFLDMSRLDANILELESAPIEVSAVVDEEIDILRQRRSDVRVVVERPDDERLVPSDEQRVRQIVGNLLDNAAKYGGSPARIDVAVREESQGVAVYVRDHGQGIALDDQPFIFDRFFRASTAKEGQGLGLGLHIAKQLADHLGATLTFTSEPGDGTQFRFWLPDQPVPRERRRYSSPARLTWSRRS